MYAFAMQHAGIICLLPSDISKNTHPQPLPTFYVLKKEDAFNFLNNQMYTLPVAQIRKNA